MLTNYLKIAFRSLLRNKVFSTINILGLSLGMAVVLLIAVFVKHEFSYDQFIDNKENVYRVYRYWSKNGGKTVWTPSRLAEKLKTEFPEVVASTGLSPFGEQLVEYRGDKLYVEHTAQVDSTFFHTLSMPFLHGDPSSALDQPDGIVISDRLSKRIFGENNPVGETIRVSGESDMQVTGVVALEGKNTHADYDFYRRFTWYSDSWTGNNRATYVRLQPNALAADLEKKIDATLKPLIEKDFLSYNYTPTKEDFADWKLQPLLDIHLRSQSGFFSKKAGNIRNIYIFLLIAGLVLVVAIVNYVNLATAQATKRAKEVGVRKASGALRAQLTGQFMTEAIFQTSLAALLAVGLAQALLPFFNVVTDRELSLLGANGLWILLPLLGLTVITGLLAGFYPALVLSGFQPVKALKTNFLKSGEKGGFRKVLVTGQFTVTIALLVVMAFIYRQVNFMMKHELGFQPDQVVSIPINFTASHYKLEGMKSAFESIPGVNSLTTANTLPGSKFQPDWGMQIEGRAEGVSPNVIFTDGDFDETMSLEMVDGRFLSDEIGADTIDNFVVNEAFVEKYNIENPLETKVKFTSSEEYGQIVGVVKNFHLRGLQRDIRPMVMNGRHQRWYAAVQLSTANISETIFEIEKLWKQIEPEHPMRYTFVDENFAELYAEQQRFGETMLYATFLTLFIAILGLFGLTAFNVERRTKEIGVRKVLGASVSSIVGLLSKDFLKLVAIAFVVAVPLGWYATNLWLEDFAFRTEVSWWIFAAAGALALVVAFFTMAFQSTRAAMANPVDSLRSE